MTAYEEFLECDHVFWFWKRHRIVEVVKGKRTYVGVWRFGCICPEMDEL